METTAIVHADVYTTTAIAVVCLFCGMIIKRRCHWFETWCIPSPFIGGLCFSLIALAGCLILDIRLILDTTIGEIAMTAFFTAIGFQADLHILKKIAFSLVIFALATVLLIVVQNAAGVGTAVLAGYSPLTGLNLGSAPLSSGDECKEYFKQIFLYFRISNTSEIIDGGNVFGLLTGTVCGSVFAAWLIMRRRLSPQIPDTTATAAKEKPAGSAPETSLPPSRLLLAKIQATLASGYASAAYQIAIAMGLGALIHGLGTQIGVSIPVFIGAMASACALNILSKYRKSLTIRRSELSSLSSLCLSFYLGVAFIDLRLWDLGALAAPMYLILTANLLVTLLVIYLLVFLLLGRSYDAAVVSAGAIGLGLGSLACGMACVMALTGRFGPSIRAYLLIPIIGALLTEPVNQAILTYCINLF